MEATSEDIAAVMMLNCEMCLQPCTRNSATDKFTPDEYNEAEAQRTAMLIATVALTALMKFPEPFVVPEMLSEALAMLLVSGI
jgi:hypothetical protein